MKLRLLRLSAPLAFGALLALGLASVGGTSAEAQDSTGDVAKACEDNSNSPPGLCECVGERSGELSSDQRAFYVAAMNQNDAETTRLRGVLSPMELIDVATFMRTSPVDCVSQN